MKKKVIGLIDSGSGNIGSIKKSILNTIENKPYQLKVVKTKKDFNGVDKIILPGQGAFATLINNLHKKNLYNELLILITKLSVPYLGICVGMQILATYGHENKKIKGLDIIKGEIVKFKKKNMIIPHMGWNSIKIKNPNIIFDQRTDLQDFYFVHSYYFKGVSTKNVTATTRYNINFPSAVHKGNIYGVQFHPEKSHKAGCKIIKNFIFKS
ncbi:imidazole glycerol phosphate synthase subunit HisH [Alphaproteobacteria bacterium]|nr:imidazole glycerol phosphate synthase subunit HisH [Alphaproteobacteria bacterium]